MAFRDWPSSDGQNMFLYPWLKSAGDKFLEHGHRLAGILSAHQHRPGRRRLVGTSRRALGAGGWRRGAGRRHRAGNSGGQRVLLDERGLAFLHGSFAALVLALMAVVALVTSRGWFAAIGSRRPRSRWAGCRLLAARDAAASCSSNTSWGACCGTGEWCSYEHLGFAFVAALMAIWLAMSAAASGNRLAARAPRRALGAADDRAVGAWRRGLGDEVRIWRLRRRRTARPSRLSCGRRMSCAACCCS